MRTPFLSNKSIAPTANKTNFHEAVERHADEQVAGLQKEKATSQAQLDIAREDVEKRERQIRPHGGRLSDEDLEWLRVKRRYISNREDQVANVDRSIAYRGERAKLQLERGPAVIAAAVQETADLVNRLADLKPLFESATTKCKAVRELLTEVLPSGQVKTVGVPTSPNGSTVLLVIKMLEPLFGSESPNANLLTRVLDDARHCGLDVGK